MSTDVERTVVTFLGRTPESVEPAAAVEILQHIDDYDPPDDYPNRVSNIESLDADNVEGALFVFGDSVPEEFDVQKAQPHLFHAEYEDGRVHVNFRTTMESLLDFLPLLDHCLEVTDLQVGADDHDRENFDIQIRTDYLVDVDEVEAPVGWMLRAQHDGDAGSSLLRFTLLDTPVLTDSTQPITEPLGDIHTVRANLTRRTDVSPDRSSPASLVEDFYTIDENPNLTTQQQLQEFVNDLAHSEGLFAHLDEVDPKEESTVLDMEVSVMEADLDGDAVQEWIDDHPQLRMFVADDAAATIAMGEVAVVEAELHLEVDGEEDTEVNEHLLATEDGEWKLVR